MSTKSAPQPVARSSTAHSASARTNEPSPWPSMSGFTPNTGAFGAGMFVARKSGNPFPSKSPQAMPIEKHATSAPLPALMSVKTPPSFRQSSFAAKSGARCPRSFEM